MNDILEKLKFPSIALLVVGILNALFGLYLIVSMLVQLAMGAANRPYVSESERIGFLVGFFGSGVLGVLSLAVSPIIIYGALQMMKGQRYGLAKTASILAMIPFVSCCFVFGVPLGIWSFITLKKPEVKAFFNGETDNQVYNPPPPDNFA